MRILNAILITLLLCWNAYAQDTINATPVKRQIATTIGVDTDDAIAYAKQIMMGDFGGSSGESVKSFLERTKLYAEYSDDGTTWVATSATTNTHIRLRARSEDDWVVIPFKDPLIREFFFQWSAPNPATVFESAARGGSRFWWQTGDQGHAPHADQFDHVYYQNSGAVKDTAGVVIPTGARGNTVNLQRGTISRYVSSVTYDDADGVSQTIRSSATTTVWRLLFVMEDQNAIDTMLTAIKARISALEGGSSTGGGGTAITAGTGITITGTNPKSIAVDQGVLRLAFSQLTGTSAAVTDAMLANSAKTIILEFSSDAETWNTTAQAGDQYFRFNVAGGPYSDAIEKGVSGEDVTETVERYVESHNLTLPHVPQWLSIHRQFLRRNSAFSLDLKPLVTGELTFQGTNLPSGLRLQNGVINGTPTTEQTIFTTITASNEDGSSEITIPFIVLRDVSFTTSLRGITGLTTRGTNIQALYGPTAIIYTYSKLGVVSSTTTNLRTEAQFNPTNAVGLAWRDLGGGTGAYTVIGGTRNEQMAKYFTDGNIDGSAITDSRLINSRGLTYGSNRYWVVAQTISSPAAAQVIPLDDNLVVQPSERFGVTADPEAVAFFENRLYIVDDTENKVYAYDVASASRGTALPYYNFDLDSDNGQPSGIAYLDSYFYVTEEGQGAVNDSLFVYPNKKLYDPDVPNLERLQFITRGTYVTNNAIRIRATFSGPVDISSDTTLRLNVGGTERQAVSISHYDDVVSGGQTNTSVAHFYYQVQAGDLDSDGVTTYQFPFSTTGTIKHSGDTLSEHYLNTNSAYRVAQPGGLNTLFANPANRVNSLDQANWTETDTTAPDYIQNRPSYFPVAPNSISNTELNTIGGDGTPAQVLRRAAGDNLEWWTLAIAWDHITGKPTSGTSPTLTVPDTASLGLFEWVRDDDLGIQFVASGTSYTSLSVAIISAYNNWATTATFNSGQWLLMRIPDAALTSLPSVYLSGVGLPDFGGQLSGVSGADTSGNIWHKFPAPNPYLRHTYYAVKAAATSNGNAFIAKRKMRYDNLAGAPTIPADQVQADWAETSTSEKDFIKNKPDLPFYYEGQTVDSYLGSRSRSRTRDVSIPSRLSTYSTTYGEKIIVHLSIRWSATDDSANPSDTVNMRIDILDSSGNALSPAVSLTRNGIPQSGAFDFIAADLPVGTTAFKIKGSWLAGPADGQIDNYHYRLGIDSEVADTIAAGTGITVNDTGSTSTISITDQGVDTGQIKDDAVTIDKLDITPNPPLVIGDELTFSADGLAAAPRFYPERITADSAVQITLRAGVPNLTQATGLTYSADIEADAAARTGQAVVVKLQDGHDKRDYLIHIGNPSSSANGVTSYRYTLSSLTSIGSESGHEYLSTPVITIPAALPVYVLEIQEYAAKQVVDAYHSVAGNVQDGLTDLTATAPLTVTGDSSSKVIALPDDTLTANKLHASTDDQKKSFRDKIGAAAISNFEMQTTFSILGFNAVLSPYAYDLPITIPADQVKEAAGRPYEIQISGSIEARNKLEDTTIAVEIRSAAGTGGTLWKTIDVESATGATGAQSFTISAMLPPTETQFYVRFNRTAGVAPDGFDGHQAYGKVKIGTLAENVYVKSDADGILPVTDDTVQEVVDKIDSLTASDIPVDASSFDKNLGNTDTNLQLVADKVDQLSTAVGGAPDQVIPRTQYNGNNAAPTPRATYNINTDLVTANATDTYNMAATITVTVHNGATLGTGVFRYRLQQSSAAGILAETTVTVSATTGNTFTWQVYLPAGTTQLVIKGSRRSTTGFVLLSVSGRIYVESVIPASKVLVNASGYGNQLATTDVTGQLIFDKLNASPLSLFTGATVITWNPTLNTTHTATGFRFEMLTSNFVKLGKMRFVSGIIKIKPNRYLTSGNVYITIPDHNISGSWYGTAGHANANYYPGDDVLVSVNSGNMIFSFKRTAPNSDDDFNVAFNIAYKIN